MKSNTINNNTIISFWIIDCSYFYTPTTIDPPCAHVRIIHGLFEIKVKKK